jgi:dipeptidyl aminopeptidase/acylaminoacyl peptidase
MKCRQVGGCGSIAAHLTLPPDITGPEPAAPLPAVIIPRPRPSHEDVADPHYLVQFLAASGYAVLRVSNRVEAEFGRGWTEERAIIGWQQSVADIADSAKYLVDNGIAEAGQICRAGKDYGGYTALMTAIEQPELFRCVVTIGAVTDPRETPGADMVNAVADSARNAMNAASSCGGNR